MPRHAARWVFTGDALLARRAVVTDRDGTILAIEPAAGPVEPGLLMPGLINAHAHLELSAWAGRVPGGAGSVAWVRALSDRRAAPADPDAPARAARAARAMGTAFLVDVSNGGGTGPAMAAAGLRGVVQVERLGVSAARWRDAPPPPPDLPGVRHRVTAHSPISCSPALLSAVLTPGGPSPTLHCDEDPADRQLLSRRAGPWAEFHAALATRLPDHDWRGGLPRGPSGVAALDGLGLLGPHLGLVHLVAADDDDLDRVAAAGATAVLCPRSNRHIGGALPDVPGMLARGIPLALGTDSLASTPNLDLLAEAATLAAAFPRFSAETWLTAATLGGARLLDDPNAGRLRVGARPGLLHVAVPASDHPLSTLLDGTPWPRSWRP